MSALKDWRLMACRIQNLSKSREKHLITPLDLGKGEMTRTISPHHLSLSPLITALPFWILNTLMWASAAWYNHTDLMWFNAISPHSLWETVLFCFKGNGVWFCGNDPTASPQNNSAGKWWGDVIKQTVVYEKLFAPSGIVECLNHCVEPKGFVIIMKASQQLQQRRRFRAGWSC